MKWSGTDADPRKGHGIGDPPVAGLKHDSPRAGHEDLVGAALPVRSG